MPPSLVPGRRKRGRSSFARRLSRLAAMESSEGDCAIAAAARCGGAIFAPERLFQWTPRVSRFATIQTCGGTTDEDTPLRRRRH